MGELVAAPSPTAKPGIDLDVAALRLRLQAHALDAPRSPTTRGRRFRRGRPVLQGAWDLIKRIYDDFTFDPTATDISTPVTQVLQQRRGVCQDFSHLALACLRAHAPAGPLRQRLHPDEPAAGRSRGLPAPTPRTPGSRCGRRRLGWVDFDPTNGLMPREEHITIAYGRDYDDVSPISGILLGGSEHSVHVGVDVVPVG